MSDIKEAIHTFISEYDKGFHSIVAVKENKIIGLVSWLMHGLPKHGLFKLDRICILVQSRGSGIGSKIVHKLIEDAKVFYDHYGENIRKLYLLTHEDNITAHCFYEKIGFRHETTLKGHYYKEKDERVYSIFYK